MSGKKGFSLYIHIPFCSKKCPYCHFFVVPTKNQDEARFVNALLLEWNLKKHLIPADEVITLYFGGGTPTELSTESLSYLIKTFKEAYPFIQEVTVEANPESVSLDKIQAIKKAGCNRISLGVQSLVEEDLILLKRQHQSKKAIDAIFICKEAGIDNISIDLMYDLPNQTLESLSRTLQVLPNLPITHLSLYNLVIEEHTPFKRIEKELLKKMPDDNLSIKLFNLTKSSLEEMGFKRYEISAFSKEGYRSKHNTGYWESRPFLGLGPSSFSDDGKTRSKNISHLMKYYEKVENHEDPKDFEECLSDLSRMKERFVVRLRLFDPIILRDFFDQHGLPDQEFLDSLEDLEKKNLIVYDKKTVLLTEKGANFFNEIASLLI
jgi:oxygen-independent coproporphyrinogen-3 oxidase